MGALASHPSIKGALASLCLLFGRGTPAFLKFRWKEQRQPQQAAGCQPTGPPSHRGAREQDRRQGSES